MRSVGLGLFALSRCGDTVKSAADDFVSKPPGIDLSTTDFAVPANMHGHPEVGSGSAPREPSSVSVWPKSNMIDGDELSRIGAVNMTQIPVAPYTPNLDWMRRMAIQHGHLGGNKTMTELLSTPAGQQWLKATTLGGTPPTVPGNSRDAWTADGKGVR